MKRLALFSLNDDKETFQNVVCCSLIKHLQAMKLLITWITLCLTTGLRECEAEPFMLSQDLVQEKDQSCGIQRGCFHDCANKGCTFLITWSHRPEADAVDFSMNFQLEDHYMYDTKWFAIGFSDDKHMGDDSVIECNADTVFYWLADVSQSYNIGRYNTDIFQSKLGLSEISGRVKGNILSCNFTRDLTLFKEPRIFSLDRPWYMFIASGQRKDGQKLKHATKPHVSPVKIDVRTNVVLEGKEAVIMIKVHGCLMIFAWVVAASVSVVIARYYKNVWNETGSGVSHKTWYQIHRFLMMVAFLTVVAAFVIIWVDVRGFAQLAEASFYHRAHPILGIIIMGLTIVNPTMAILRPRSGTLARPVFKWAHTFVGTILYILAILNIIIGVTLEKTPAPSYIFWILIGFVVYQLLLEVLLEVHECTLIKAGRLSDYVMKELSSSSTETDSTTSSKTAGSTVKKVVLSLHIIITLGFGITCIAFIIIS